MEPLQELILTVQAAIERGRRRAALLGAGLLLVGVVAGATLACVVRG